jgi:hypothetical protein
MNGLLATRRERSFNEIWLAPSGNEFLMGKKDGGKLGRVHNRKDLSLI